MRTDRNHVLAHEYVSTEPDITNSGPSFLPSLERLSAVSASLAGTDNAAGLAGEMQYEPPVGQSQGSSAFASSPGQDNREVSWNVSRSSGSSEPPACPAEDGANLTVANLHFF